MTYAHPAQPTASGYWTRYNTSWMHITESSNVYLQTKIGGTAPLAHELLELQKVLHSDGYILPTFVRLTVLGPWKATY